MTTVSLRFEDSMKRELDEMCSEMGMNLTTFFTIYAKRALRDRKIPFDITAPIDLFDSDRNRKQIERAVRQVETGATVTKTIEELEALA